MYRLDHAYRMDYVMQLAERHGIYVKLCLESWRGFSGQGSFVRESDLHPPIPKRSGCSATVCATRWRGGAIRRTCSRGSSGTRSTARGYDPEVVAAWTQEMARYLKTIDPHQRPVVNSLGSFRIDERYWRLPEVDFAQAHGYWRPARESRESGKDMAQFIASWVERLRGFGKLALFAEFGLVNERWGPRPLAEKDKEGVHLHNGLWSAMMSGACGTGGL